MDWIAVGAMAEIVGAIAVVLTLAYLALQVNHATQTARRAAVAEAVSAIREANAHLADDPAAATIFRKGVDGLENLSTEEEKVQFGILTFNLFKTCEHLHYQWVVGAMDSEVWGGWKWHMKGYLMFPGNRQWYEERRRSFSSRFQGWVDNMEPDESFRSIRQVE